MLDDYPINANVEFLSKCAFFPYSVEENVESKSFKNISPVSMLNKFGAYSMI